MPSDMSPADWPGRRLSTDLALAFGLFAVLGYAAIVVARLPGTIAVVWLANGVSVALVATAPRERAWKMLAAAGLGNLVANLAYGDPLSLSAAFVPPNLLEVAIGVWLLRRTGLVQRYAEDERIFARVLFAGALLPPLAGATLGAATLQALGFAQFTRVWTDWYIGAALGAAAMLPLCLALLSASDPQALWQRVALPPTLAVLAALGALIAAVRWLPYPFVAIGVALTVVAFMRPRVEAFAGVALVVVGLALMLAFGALVVGTKPVDRALLFLAVLLAVLPPQLVAVAVARQRALSRTLAAVGSRVDDIVTLTDLDGVLRWANQAREAYWGTPNQQVLGRRVEQVLPAEVLNQFQRPMFDAAREGRMVRRLTEVDYPGKGRRTMDMSMQPARDEEGRLIGVLYCAADVTELEASRREVERTAEALRNSNQNLEQFVRIASHDLREPLNTITQFCGLIEQRHAAQLEGPAATYFAHVRQAAQRMRSMMDDMLEYVRLEQPRDEPFEAVDLEGVWADVQADLHALVKASGADLSAAPLGMVQGHRALLALALQNLVGNALKFVASGTVPQVRLSLQREGAEVRLTVADNGIGIDSARIAELGTPFRRLHARRKYEGTGLGLAICCRIAEQHRGRLEIASEPGAGSRFTLAWAQPS